MTSMKKSIAPMDDELITSCQFCTLCEINNEEVINMVNHGLLDPRGQSLKSWCFTAKDIILVKRAKRLQQDFDLNLPGVTFILELLDEIQYLREQLQRWGKIS